MAKPVKNGADTKFKPGNKGRPKGAKNKATVEIKALATRLLTNPLYVKALERRLVDGTAGAVEVALYHYAFGKPKSVHEHSGPDGGPITVTIESLKAAAAKRRATFAEPVNGNGRA